jgi:hypothetical protein
MTSFTQKIVSKIIKNIHFKQNISFKIYSQVLIRKILIKTKN